MEKKRVVLLGATGSIGQNSCAILSANTDRYETVAVAARSSLDALADAAVKLNAGIALTTDTARESELAAKLPAGIRAASGMDELLNIVTAPEVDIVVCAIIGTAGIKPVLAAIEAGKTIALASKEVMVAAGDLVNAALKANPQAKLLPVDSEHSGVFQCLEGRRTDEVDTIWLTASGGPFRTWDSERIQRATVSEALAHPTWQMGRKITIDSASMMNKALELIEARYLFDLQPEQLDVVINPQSIVHALAELTDGSMLAQMSVPDMRLAIA